MGAKHLGRSLLAIHTGSDLFAVFRDADTLGVQTDSDSFPLHNLLDGRRDILIFVLNEPWSHLDDRDLAAEAPEHLAEFEADVTAADDHEMTWEKVHLHHGAVVEAVHLVESRHRRSDGAAADVDKNLAGGEHLGAHLHF